MLSNVPVVRAGDTVVVCVSVPITFEDMERFTEALQQGLPGVRVAFMENVSGLAVFRPEATESE